MTSRPFEDTTTFTAKPKAASSPTNESRGIVTRSRKERRPEVKETPMDELFETEYVPTDDMLAKVRDLMSRHKAVLSMTKPESKVMQATLLRVRQLVSGEFLFAYTWDRSWFNRLVNMDPLELMEFDSVDSLLAKLDDVLSYVDERQKYGYWFPSKRNGKACRTSLADFIARPMKDGNWWSPFVEIACGDAVTPSMYRKALGEQACKVLDGILDKAWFTKDFNNTVRFYKGAMDLRKWLDANGLKLRDRSPENNYNLANYGTLIERVAQCNDETGCVGPTFIGPWSNRWSVFKDWMQKVHGVKI